jgi:dTDP-4-dehydrorhamnose reductase
VPPLRFVYCSVLTASLALNCSAYWHALDRQACDLSDSDRVRAVIRALTPAVIVNAAAYTAVDRAESEPESAYAVNADALAVLAEEARAVSAMVLHYSTDYVFDGSSERAYVETDAASPINVYGRSKLAGETVLAQALGSDYPYWIVRSSWVYGCHGNNFLKTMLKQATERDALAVVADQFGAPTSAGLLARCSLQLLQQRPASGLYHLAATGCTSWHAYACFAIAHAQQVGLPLRIDPTEIRAISTDDYPRPAARPHFSLLDCAKLEQALSLRLPEWQADVRDTVDVLVRDYA